MRPCRTGGGGAPFRSDGLRDLVRGGDPGTHQRAGNAGGQYSSSILPASVVGAECRPDERKLIGCRLSLASGQHGVLEAVSDGVRNPLVDRAAFCSVGSKVHSGEEEHSG